MVIEVIYYTDEVPAGILIDRIERNTYQECIDAVIQKIDSLTNRCGERKLYVRFKNAVNRLT